MLLELSAFRELLYYQGVPAALAYLNSCTPHRYTGFFRFDGDTLRNEALFDCQHPEVRQSDDVPLAATYYALVGRQQAPLEILDAAVGPFTAGVATLVISSCGVLVRDAHGRVYGTLFHYDLQHC